MVGRQPLIQSCPEEKGLGRPRGFGFSSFIIYPEAYALVSHYRFPSWGPILKFSLPAHVATDQGIASPQIRNRLVICEENGTEGLRGWGGKLLEAPSSF